MKFFWPLAIAIDPIRRRKSLQYKGLHLAQKYLQFVATKWLHLTDTASTVVLAMQATGRNIRAERNRRGLAAIDLADQAKINVYTLYAIESGRQVPMADTLQRIAAALDVSVDLLLQPAPPAPSSAQDNGQSALRSVDQQPASPSSVTVRSERQRRGNGKARQAPAA